MRAANGVDSPLSSDHQIGLSNANELPREGRWHLLHTKSRQEKLLAEELSHMGIGHFLPLVRRTRRYGPRKEHVEIPLFPGYVFVRGSIEDAYQANRTHRVARIIPVIDQSCLDWELTNLSFALRNNASVDSDPYLRKGVRVEVRSGSFRGLQGLIEDRLPSGKLILQVQMLGRAVSMELHGAILEAI
jgi:transcriptional antiterminator NusG